MKISDPRPEAADVVRELEAVLGRRLDDVEREHRVLRQRSRFAQAGLSAVIVLLGGALVSLRVATSGVHEVVEARRFVLLDTEGNSRAVISVDADDASRIVLQDPDGRERLRLSLLADGSTGMAFADRQGQSRAVLGLLPDETSTLVFADRLGQTRAVLGLSPDESTTLLFADRAGNTRVEIDVDANGSPAVSVYERGEPAWGETGETAVSAVARPDGAGD
jgi:hypothetical protein